MDEVKALSQCVMVQVGWGCMHVEPGIEITPKPYSAHDIKDQRILVQLISTCNYHCHVGGYKNTMQGIQCMRRCYCSVTVSPSKPSLRM